MASHDFTIVLNLTLSNTTRSNVTAINEIAERRVKLESCVWAKERGGVFLMSFSTNHQPIARREYAVEQDNRAKKKNPAVVEYQNPVTCPQNPPTSSYDLSVLLKQVSFLSLD